MGAVNRVMIGPAGIVDLHVTTTTGYEEMQQWGGREDASTALFDQWLNGSVLRRIPEESRLGILSPPPSFPCIWLT